MSSWWEDLPCPFHPTWELDDISERDVRQLKQNLDADDDNGMVVETAVYRAFLEFPRKRVFYNQPIDDPIQARKHLISAKELVKEKFEGNSDAEIGYGIVINTFQMYIEKDASTESILRDLILKKDGYPRHQCYVNVVRAYILSRLGPRRYGCALSLFDSALKESPENCDWLLGKALLIGREAREIGYILGWSDRHVLDLLHEQKVVLEGILKLEPDYHLARALYGQVLMNLGEGGAKAEISRSLLNDPPRQSVGMVAARFYKKVKNFKSARKILEVLLKTYNTAETHFQLGIITSIEASRLVITNKQSIEQRKSFRRERTKLWNQSLQHFNNCLRLNSSHYPCLTRQAEVNALLGNTTKAHEMFQQLLEHIYKDSPHLHRNEIMTLERVFYLNSCLTRNKQIFSTREIIKYSHRYVTLVTEEYAIMLKVVDHSNDKVEKRLATLQEISSDESQEEDVRRLATLKLADANRRLQRFQKAKSIYETLFGKNEASSDKAEVIWGLAKCYLRLDLEEKVISFANQLKEIDQTTKQFTANELYADVFLRKAKSKLGNERPFPSDNLFLFKSVYVHLKQAIKMGSLEASYLFLSLVETIKEHFFSLEFGFPEILGHIRLLCGTSYKGTIVHTHFNITLDDGSEVLYDETTTKSSIMKKLLKILKYEYTNDAENLSTELYKQLEKLREQRLEFEIHLLESKEREWDEPCRRSLIDIVPTLRDLLDHSVSFYMKTVLSYSPEKSIFPVKFDKKAGQVDRNVARKKLQTWIKETFQKYPGKPPEEVIQTILEVQPMYDSENYWLAALHELNNNLKHNTKSYANETFELRVDKPGASLTMKSEDIVRKSCQEVERIVSYFLSK